MGIVGSPILAAGGGGASDIRDTYQAANGGNAVTNADSPYTIPTNGSYVCYVDSSAGVVNITSFAGTSSDGDRVLIIDVAGAAGTNAIQFNGGNVIETNDEQVEFIYVNDTSSWEVSDSAISAADVKALYESNLDTNVFDNAAQTQVANIDNTAIKYALALG